MGYFTPKRCVLSRKGVLYPEMAYCIPKWSTTGNPVLNWSYSANPITFIQSVIVVGRYLIFYCIIYGRNLWKARRSPFCFRNLHTKRLLPALSVKLRSCSQYCIVFISLFVLITVSLYTKNEAAAICSLFDYWITITYCLIIISYLYH
jgi:hypothetical protein